MADRRIAVVLRRALSVVCAAIVLAAAGGCREEDPVVASACREGPGPVLTALRAAPGEVRLDGDTPLSKCLTNAEDGGELTDVGTAFVTAAQRLADRAEREPGGAAAVQLGYLVGAVRRGSLPDQGLAYELVRRIEGEAARAGRPSAAFHRGLRAGRRDG
jgi:hypothetical protein